MNIEEIMNVDKYIRKSHGFGVITIKMRILLYALLNPGRPIKDVQAESGLSHRGFYLNIQELIESQCVVISEDVVDRRRRCVFVTDWYSESIAQAFGIEKT